MKKNAKEDTSYIVPGVVGDRYDYFDYDDDIEDDVTQSGPMCGACLENEKYQILASAKTQCWRERSFLRRHCIVIIT
jgi:hypothetical protein